MISWNKTESGMNISLNPNPERAGPNKDGLTFSIGIDRSAVPQNSREATETERQALFGQAAGDGSEGRQNPPDSDNLRWRLNGDTLIWALAFVPVTVFACLFCCSVFGFR